MYIPQTQRKGNKVKKILFVCMLVVALVCALGSCNSSDLPQETTSVTPQETNATTPQGITVTTPEETTPKIHEETTTKAPEEIDSPKNNLAYKVNEDWNLMLP